MSKGVYGARPRGLGTQSEPPFPLQAGGKGPPRPCLQGLVRHWAQQVDTASGPPPPRCPDPGGHQRLHQLLTPGLRRDRPPVRPPAGAARPRRLRLVPGPGLGLVRLGGAQWHPSTHSSPRPPPEPAAGGPPLGGRLSPRGAGAGGMGSVSLCLRRVRRLGGDPGGGGGRAGGQSQGSGLLLPGKAGCLAGSLPSPSLCPSGTNWFGLLLGLRKRSPRRS